MLLSIVIVAAGCSSAGLTRKQKEALENNLDFVADAIHYSAIKFQQVVSEFHQKHGAWPASAEEKKAVLDFIDSILKEHGINRARVLVIDTNEVLVEYNFSRLEVRQFPLLLDSWAIIFSNKNGERLDVVGVYPSWRDPEQLASETSYKVEQIERLQILFRQRLREILKKYSIVLYENINESI